MSFAHRVARRSITRPRTKQRRNGGWNAQDKQKPPTRRELRRIHPHPGRRPLLARCVQRPPDRGRIAQFAPRGDGIRRGGRRRQRPAAVPRACRTCRPLTMPPDAPAKSGVVVRPQRDVAVAPMQDGAAGKSEAEPMLRNPGGRTASNRANVERVAQRRAELVKRIQQLAREEARTEGGKVRRVR